jgi:LacI family transcriptional regulator
MKHVARRAGVSIMTVSNVINGRASKVSARTRAKVEAAMTRLSFRPDPAGRSLRLSRQFLIEMIIVDPSPAFVADAFITSIVAGLANYLNQRNYGLILRGTNYERLHEPGTLRSRQTDALCVLASGLRKQRQAIYRQLAAHRDPMVIFQDDAPADLPDAISLKQDDAAGGKLLANHLIAQGCRKFVWVSLAHPWPAFEQRAAGVTRAIRAAGAGASLETLTADRGDYVAVQSVVAAHVARHGVPDAFLCGNDQIAIAVGNWLQDHGHRIPKDVRVTGFNAFDFWRYSRPALTTIESPAYALGELGAEMLVERLRVGKFARHQTVLPVELRRGAS